jgi:pimeloyl-[acyl-carrier protein] methyl ester esterase
MIIFLHGWTMNGAAFDGQIERLGQKFHCLAPDLPGHGKMAEIDASLDACGQLLAELVNEHKNQKIILVGWSMGAAVAWNYLRRYGQDKISGLVSVDMSPKIVNENDWRLGLIGRTPETIALSTKHLLNDWNASSIAVASGMFKDETGPEHFSAEDAAKIIAKQTPEQMLAMWVELTKLDERISVQNISLPWAVFYGEQSRAYGLPVAQWLYDAAPNTQLVGFDRAGHSPHLEQPDQFALEIERFVKSLPEN